MNKPSHEYCKECNDWNGNISKCMEICGIPIHIIAEWEKYHAIGTVEEIKQKLAELERWNTTEVNPKIKNVFANTSTQICHNCDHKDEYIEELEAEIEGYRKIGTVEECRYAVEKQIPKKPYIQQVKI